MAMPSDNVGPQRPPERRSAPGRELNMPSCFEHRPLDLSQPSIRLLDVLPRDGRSEIRCAVKHVLLPASCKELRYTALSYARGDEKEPRHAISINNQPYEVLKNLYTFLDLHGLNGISNLFIDALCIAQNNIDEKNHQVQLMKDIFTNAAKVIVWLGPSADRSDELFDMISELGPFEVQDGIRGNYISGPQSNFDVQLRLACKADAIGSQTSKLCLRKYWTRAWIVQEIVLARELDLVCGAKWLPWIAWVYYLRLLLGLERNMKNVWKAPPAFEALTAALKSSVIASLCEQRSSTRHRNKSRPLLSLVAKFARSECLLPHDKIYAFLGLSSDAQTVSVNYSLTPENLLLEMLCLISRSAVGKSSKRKVNGKPTAQATRAIFVAQVHHLCHSLGFHPAALTLMLDYNMSARANRAPSFYRSTQIEADLYNAVAKLPAKEAMMEYHLPHVRSMQQADKTLLCLSQPAFHLRDFVLDRQWLSPKLTTAMVYDNTFICFCVRCEKKGIDLVRMGMAWISRGDWFDIFRVDVPSPQPEIKGFPDNRGGRYAELCYLRGSYIATRIGSKSAGDGKWSFDPRVKPKYVLYHDPPQGRDENAVLSMHQILNLIAHDGRYHRHGNTINSANDIVGRPVFPLKELHRLSTPDAQQQIRAAYSQRTIVEWKDPDNYPDWTAIEPQRTKSPLKRSILF
ncbi:uncharacterized protein PV07_05046 [Cladophialophora immunda]|uniref:Heterokaryon incompatibility domain-containing protein n=1 Tax=Cladophialophora immunda TaxID=569365 RepID=A0A0D2D0A0_9EURO|nr:uncharacterized protein PV07_05046 [Cladophialophora immunda]KIW29219.1 hypothetical protein PV07_05046 [Cladophialophora immunda]